MMSMVTKYRRVMKTTELSKEQINYWVAKAQGWEHVANEDWDMGNGYYHSQYSPSTNWQQAGELVEKFKLALEGKDYGWLCGGIRADTPTKAICLAVIASVYGDEVPESEDE